MKKKHRSEGVGEAEGSRGQGFEGSSGERQKTEVRSQKTEDRRRKSGEG